MVLQDLYFLAVLAVATVSVSCLYTRDMYGVAMRNTQFMIENI